MTAENFRKIGVLQRLLSNGSLNPGTTGPLLWDEPESNLNPKLMKDLVLALLELARNGQQVILATHDYVLLKWFDLLMDKGKGDQVVFHRLYRNDGSDDIQLESQSDYSIVGRSAISNSFTSFRGSAAQAKRAWRRHSQRLWEGNALTLPSRLVGEIVMIYWGITTPSRNASMSGTASKVSTVRKQPPTRTGATSSCLTR